jgi:hypothetical protein
VSRSVSRCGLLWLETNRLTNTVARHHQARAKAASKPGGKLQSQLSAQKRQSRTDTLKQASADEQRRRDIADNEATTYN